MDNVLLDLRSAIRSLRKTPWFTLAVTLTLAIAIGANTLIFSVVNAVLLQPMAYADASRLVMVRQVDGKSLTVSAPAVRDWREQIHTLAGVAAYQPGSATMTGLAEPVRLTTCAVTANWFALLGLSAEVGRAFEPDEDQVGAPAVVVLSDAMWRSRFAADPRVVGQTIDLDGSPRLVVGIAPRTATFPNSPDVWIPRVFTAADLSDARRGAHVLEAIARVAPTTTVDAARREFEAVAERIRQQHLPTEGIFHYTLRPLRDSVVGESRRALFILMGAVACVLLVACANVANLLLVRASGRSAELGVRIALGAGRFGIMRQLITESLVLALIGALGGVALAYGGAHFLIAMRPGDIPRLDEVQISVPVLVFTGVVAVITGLSFGLAPAMQATNHDIVDALKSGMRGSSANRRSGRLRDILVVAETALAVLLLIGAGLLTRSLTRMMAVDLGFVPEHVVRFDVQLPQARYTSWSRMQSFTHSVLADMQSQPGTSTAALASGAPFTVGRSFNLAFDISGRVPNPPGHPSLADIEMVSPRYISALGIPVRRGRAFTDDDRAGGHQVIMINDALARQYFAHEDPIGQRMRLEALFDSTSNPADTVAVGGEIVGVVGDTRDRDVTAAAKPTVYLPFDQASIGYLTFVVRTTGDPAAVIAGARQAVARADPLVPIFKAQTYAAAIGAYIARPRLYAIIVGAFALSALALAIIGIYGVLAYTVRERRRELGIRIALGASGRQVVGMVVGQGVRLAGAGLLVGIAIALLGGRVLASLLYNVHPDDLATYGAVCAVLLVVAIVASWLPARHAAITDPIIAMRPE